MFGITFGGVCNNVVDGDTIDVLFNRVVRVRLLDCWAPEVRTRDKDEKEAGLEAKEAMAAMVLHRPVQVTIPIEGDARFGEAMSMGRVLGNVVVTDGNERWDVGRHLIRQGYATRGKGQPRQRTHLLGLPQLVKLMDTAVPRVGPGEDGPVRPQDLPPLWSRDEFVRVAATVGQYVRVWCETNDRMMAQGPIYTLAALCVAGGLHPAEVVHEEWWGYRKLNAIVETLPHDTHPQLPHNAGGMATRTTAPPPGEGDHLADLVVRGFQQLEDMRKENNPPLPLPVGTALSVLCGALTTHLDNAPPESVTSTLRALVVVCVAAGQDPMTLTPCGGTFRDTYLKVVREVAGQ